MRAEKSSNQDSLERFERSLTNNAPQRRQTNTHTRTQTVAHIQRASNAKNQQTFSTRRRRATKALDTDGTSTVGKGEAEEEERELGICSLQLQQLLISWQHTKATSGNWQRARCHTSARRERAQVGGKPFCCPRLAAKERGSVAGAKGNSALCCAISIAFKREII